MYGDNEDLIGTWMQTRGQRSQIFLATKFANRTDAQGRFSTDSSPGYCRAALERSLQRLRVASVDLYYCHRLDGVTPVEETVRAMAALQAEGKIRYLGLSECSAESLRRAHAVHPIAAVQVEYSPFSLDIEDPHIKLLETARELGVAIVAYSPIGRGLLSGEIRSHDDIPEGDWRKNAPRFSRENFPKNFALVETIEKIAKAKNVPSAQLTLAWLLAQGRDIFPIPGTTRVERLEENLGALDITLSPEEEKEIRDACEKAVVHGSRYPASGLKSLFADTPPLKE